MSKLKHIREQKNLTQEELSEKSRISVRTIQRIEAGTIPKGHTLKTLAKILAIEPDELLQKEAETTSKDNNEIEVEDLSIDYSKIKLINLSSIVFIILPPLNILFPFFLGYLYKQKSTLVKQIISVQMLWTIAAPIIFMLGIFLKLGHGFTLVLIIFIVLSNVFIIIRNAFEIDRSKKLHYKLNFNMI